jgi:hypothetical protein
VRVALGATTGDILRLVLGAGLRIAGAVLLTRTLASLLYGVTPLD